MKATRRRALLVAALVTVLVLTTTGVAFAYVAGSGGGSGSATTGTTQPLVLSPATAAYDLYPGGVSAVTGTVHNPNMVAVKVDSVSLDITQGTAGFAVDGLHTDCGVGSLSFTTQTNGGAGWTIPGGVTLPASLPSSLKMDESAANACQGATFTVYLKVLP